MPYQLEYMNYVQHTRLSGTGVNFKLGITARPVDWLRIGVAYHTPTLMNTSLRYDADMWSATYSAGNNPDKYDLTNGYAYFNYSSPEWADVGNYSWNYTSPSRLLLGAAVTIGDRVILSADYERSWYQAMRLKSAPIWGLDYTDITKEVFKGGNTLRLGAEAYILPFMALRAGYIWSGNTLREGYEDIVATHTMPKSQSFVTAGLGLKFSEAVYLDLAYQYGRTSYTGYQTYYYTDPYDAAYDLGSRIFDDTTTKHIAVVTLGIRF
jgi:long-subunit fatty acid transport protein